MALTKTERAELDRLTKRVENSERFLGILTTFVKAEMNDTKDKYISEALKDYLFGNVSLGSKPDIKEGFHSETS